VIIAAGSVAAALYVIWVGAQVGARLAQRLHGAWIVRALVLALVFVGLRLIIKAL